MIDKKVAGLFLEIDSELQEYQKKELCILLLASMINPKPCNELSTPFFPVKDFVNTLNSLVPPSS